VRYFCDRKTETDEIIKYLENGSNITLISPRRLGKTGLIYHIFDVLEERDADYETYYIDIYPSRSFEDFLALTAEAIYTKTAGRSAIRSFLDTLKSFRPVLSTDPVTGKAQFSFTFQTDTEKRYTLKSLLDYLESRKKKVIVAIDEFQQIRSYSDISAEATLRTYIQPLKNVQFIFSGSKRHVMADMFTGEKSPFYESSAMYPIGKIDEEEYSSFIHKQFIDNGKTITDEAVGFILEWTKRHTFYTQFLCNRVFLGTRKEATLTEVLVAIDMIFKENEEAFLERRNLLTGRQWNYLIAVAKEGELSQPTSNEFLQKYHLGAQSSSLRTLEALVEKELVLETKSTAGSSYSVYNVFLSRWLERL
jgi:Predicted ATPase (AAA+ superfamily)